MAQILKPNTDITVGDWLPSAGSLLYPMLDEDSPVDSDYVYTESESIFEVGVEAASDPGSSANHFVRYRAAGDGATNLTVSLVDNSESPPAVIASWTETEVPVSETDYEHELSASEANLIADYSALSLRFEAAMMGALFADTFDRANGNLDGSTSSDTLFTWDEIGGTTQLQISSNELFANHVSHDVSYGAVTSAETDSDTAYAEITLTQWNRNASATLAFTVIIGADSTFSNGYAATLLVDAGSVIGNRLFRLSDDTVIDTDATVNPAGLGTLRIERNGSNVRALWNDVEFMSGTDTNEASGVGNRHSGVDIYAWGVGLTHNWRADNFGFGDL